MVEVLLYLAGMVLLFIEIFVPGMVLALIGGSMVAYALGVTWLEGRHAVAVPMTIATVVAVPAMVAFAVRRLRLSAELGSADGYVAGERGLDALVGEEGEAITPLRPSGTAVVAGRRLSVVAERGWIENAARIRVVRVEGYRVVVRATAPQPQVG